MKNEKLKIKNDTTHRMVVRALGIAPVMHFLAWRHSMVAVTHSSVVGANTIRPRSMRPGVTRSIPQITQTFRPLTIHIAHPDKPSGCHKMTPRRVRVAAGTAGVPLTKKRWGGSRTAPTRLQTQSSLRPTSVASTTTHPCVALKVRVSNPHRDPTPVG